MHILEGKRKLFRFQSGERIPQTGIYGVLHTKHRLPREVTLLQGEQFPVCAGCSTPVRFKLLRTLLPKLWNKSFRIHLYQLPVLEDEESGFAVAAS